MTPVRPAGYQPQAVSQNGLFLTRVVAFSVLKVHERAAGTLRWTCFGAEARTTLDFPMAFRTNRGVGGS